MNFKDLSVFTALIGGLVSFLSPCVLPMAIGYITHISGVIIKDELEEKNKLVLKRTLFFILGFSIIFTILTLSIGLLGEILSKNKRALNYISGTFIILMGVKTLGIIKIRSKNKNIASEINSSLESLLFGTAIGISWTPCIGPVLTSILLYNNMGGDTLRSIILLAFYLIGLSVPFLITALTIQRSEKILEKIGKHSKTIMKISGILMIIIGLLVFFNKMTIFLRFS